jgi:hypothetical protein
MEVGDDDSCITCSSAITRGVEGEMSFVDVNPNPAFKTSMELLPEVSNLLWSQQSFNTIF